MNKNSLVFRSNLAQPLTVQQADANVNTLADAVTAAEAVTTVAGIGDASSDAKNLIKLNTVGQQAQLGIDAVLNTVDINGFRNITGIILAPDGSQTYNAPMQGQRTILIGASREMRQNTYRSINGGASATGDCTCNGTTCTVTVVGTPDWHEGTVLLVGSQADTTASAFDASCIAYGAATRVSNGVYTVPQFSGGSGRNTSSFFAVNQSQFSCTAPFTTANSLSLGAKIFVANLSLGSNATIDMYTNIFPLVKSMVNSFDHIDGSFDVGNTVLNALNHSLSITTMLANCIPQLTIMLDWLTYHGKTITFELLPPSETTTAQAVAYGNALINAISALVPNYKGKVEVSKIFECLVLAGDNITDSRLLDAGAGVHSNFEGSQVIGYNNFFRYLSQHSVPTESPLIAAPYDRWSQSSFSTQYMEAGWSASGQAASGLDSDFSGTIWNEIQTGNLTSTGATCLFSITPRNDQFGYDQTFRLISTTGLGNIMTLALSGDPAISLLKDRVVAGGRYEGWIDIGIYPLSTTILQDFNLTMRGSVTYSGAFDGSYSAGITNTSATTINGIKYGVEGPIYIPPFTIPNRTFTTLYLEIKIRLRNVAGTVEGRFGRVSLRKI